MSRTDDILDKTKRKEPEAKKWKVIVGIVVGLVLAVCLCYVVATPLSDSYLTKSQGIAIHSEFYKNQVDNNIQSVYFIGSSVIGTAVYSPLIDSILEERGCDIETYNLHLGGDTPRVRSMEIDYIIESNPSLVIYGITCYDVTRSDDIWYNHASFSSNSPLYNRELRMFYSDDELLELLEFTCNHYLSKRGNVLGGLPDYIESIFAYESYYGDILSYIKEGYSPSTLIYNEEKYKDINGIKKVADTRYSVMNLKSDTSRYNADALIYNVKKLMDANIPVILISMPMHPIVYEAIPQNTVSEYHNLLNMTGNDWVNAEAVLDDDCFYDHFHKTWLGCQKFSEMMADLIIQELS